MTSIKQCTAYSIHHNKEKDEGYRPSIRSESPALLKPPGIPLPHLPAAPNQRSLNPRTGPPDGEFAARVVVEPEDPDPDATFPPLPPPLPPPKSPLTRLAAIVPLLRAPAVGDAPAPPFAVDADGDDVAATSSPAVESMLACEGVSPAGAAALLLDLARAPRRPSSPSNAGPCSSDAERWLPVRPEFAAEVVDGLGCGANAT